MSLGKQVALLGGLGLALGLVLGGMGFSDYQRLLEMFTFRSWSLLLAFAGAVILLVPALWLLSRRREGFRNLPRSRPHPGIWAGALLFGIGWPLCGACPAVALVQLGEGKLVALITVVGMVLGTAIYPWIHRRFFRWDQGSCGE